MMDQFAREEILNSVINQVRGRYVTLICKEEKSERPNKEEINFYRKRCKEITEEYRTIFNQTDSFKEGAIEKYSMELNKLKSFLYTRRKDKLRF